MSDHRADGSFINSIVGPGTFFRGHVELNGLLRIDGDFSGSVKTSGRVIVGQAGRADCAIDAGSVVVGGLFRGEIYAQEKVVLLSSSVVIGSITAPRLVIEPGVLVHGRCTISGSAAEEQSQSALSERRKELLLESVRTREQAAALNSEARVGDVGAVGAASSEGHRWNG
jgi:cytoskeletal protein CcmA (bactofilin family)